MSMECNTLNFQVGGHVVEPYPAGHMYFKQRPPCEKFHGIDSSLAPLTKHLMKICLDFIQPGLQRSDVGFEYMVPLGKMLHEQ